MADEWTVETLRHHLTAMLSEADRRNDQRFTDMQTALQAALAAVREETSKAERAADRRFESINEFRGLVNDLVAGKVDKTEFTLSVASILDRMEDVKERVSRNETRMTRSEGKGAGKDALWGYIVGAVGVLAALVTIVLRF